MRSPEHGRRREAGFAVADEAGRRQRRRIPGSPTFFSFPPTLRWCGFQMGAAREPLPFLPRDTSLFCSFPPARPFSAPSPPARGTFSSLARRLFTDVASIRRLGERGDAIRTEAMASPTPQLENRPDAAMRTMVPVPIVSKIL